MNRRVVAGVVAATLVIGSLGGVAATALLGGGGTTAGGDTAVAAVPAPESWSVEARGVYDAIAPVTDQAGEAVAAGDDAAYAAANEQIAVLLDGMPSHPDGEVNALYAALAQEHRRIAASADIDGEATVAAQDRVIALLERVHEIVAPF